LDGDANSAEEYVFMTVRPVPDPRKADSEIGLFGPQWQKIVNGLIEYQVS